MVLWTRFLLRLSSFLHDFSLLPPSSLLRLFVKFSFFSCVRACVAGARDIVEKNKRMIGLEAKISRAKKKANDERKLNLRLSEELRRKGAGGESFKSRP